jgi:hypothetical protein
VQEEQIKKFVVDAAVALKMGGRKLILRAIAHVQL